MKFAALTALVAATLAAPALAQVDSAALGGGLFNWILGLVFAGVVVWGILFVIGASIMKLFQAKDDTKDRPIFHAFIGFLLLVVIFMIVKYG